MIISSMTKKEHYREWYLKNRERKIASVREWQSKNNDKTIAYSAKWNANNKEYIHQVYLDKKAGLK